MDRRIFGIETEYGVTCTLEGRRRLNPDEVARYMFRKVVTWGRSSNVFLGNGARLYLDVGSHPEYATAEADGVLDAIAQDKAGERIVDDLAQDAERRLAEESIDGQVFVFKNNTDSAGNSYGCHENYLVGRGGDFHRLSDHLIPFLISRQLTCGAGKVVMLGQTPTYCVSQRADHIWEGVSSATTRSRPIINTRDEPHADAERFRRLHVIVGDSNMCEATTFLKVGATDLVLRVLETGESMPDLTLANPPKAIRTIGHDPSGRALVDLADGRRMTAVQLLWAYRELMDEHVQRHGGDEATDEVLGHLDRVLSLLEADPMSAARDLDWVAKLALLQGYRDRDGLRWDDPRALTHPAPDLPAEPWTWSGPQRTVTGPTWGGCLEIIEWTLAANRWVHPTEMYDGVVLLLEPDC